MSTPYESFRIVFPAIAELPRKDYALVDPAIALPDTANMLLMGEFLTLFIEAGKLARNTAGAGLLAFPVYAEPGSYYIQYSKMIPIIRGGRWEALTWIFNRTPGVINALGQSLTAKLVTFDGQDRSILTAVAGADATVAYVLELPGSASAPLRILSAL